MRLMSLSARLAVIASVLLFTGSQVDAFIRASSGFLYSSARPTPLHAWCALRKPTPAAGAATVLQQAAAVDDVEYPVSPFPANFWFVKTVKTGSSTLTSVFHTICTNYGVQWVKSDATRMAVGVTQPDVAKFKDLQKRFRNMTDNEYLAITNHMVYSPEIADALRPKLLFTSVRHPLQRVHSYYVQDACITAAKKGGWTNKVGHRDPQPIGPNACDLDPDFLKLALQNDSPEARRKFAEREDTRDAMYHYTRGKKFSVEDAASQYDFIFVAERLNEGLVVFMLKYGLRFEDIAYLPLKVRGGSYKTSDDMPKELNDYILNNNQKDLYLWHVANVRLDQDVAALEQNCGKGTVNNTLTAFENLLKEVHSECASYKEWYHAHGFEGPYTYTGLPEIAFDSGNGYRCVRYVARRFVFAGPSSGAPGTASFAGVLLGFNSPNQGCERTRRVWFSRALFMGGLVMLLGAMCTWLSAGRGNNSSILHSRLR